jgi:hypothetical protein
VEVFSKRNAFAFLLAQRGLLKIPDADPRDHLKQGDIVKKVHETHPKNTPKHR